MEIPPTARKYILLFPGIVIALQGHQVAANLEANFSRANRAVRGRLDFKTDKERLRGIARDVVDEFEVLEVRYIPAGLSVIGRDTGVCIRMGARGAGFFGSGNNRIGRVKCR